MWAWRNVRKVLQHLQADGNDLSDGALLPWWLFFGHTGKIFGIVDRGITGIVAQGETLRLTCTDGDVLVHAGNKGRVEVHDA